MSKPTWRRAFQSATYFTVKVSPDGFVVRDDLQADLEGRVIKTHLVRKRFEDSVLACDSRDGTTAKDGTDCESCLHPRCQPMLRMHLKEGVGVYVVDLAVTSAQNFIRLEDALETDGKKLDCTQLKLTVINHGYWGEVTFTIVE